MLYSSVPLGKYRNILNKISLSSIFPEVITHKNPSFGLDLPRELDLSLTREGLVDPYYFSANRQRNQVVGPYTLGLAEMLGLNIERFIPFAMGIDILIAGQFDIDDFNDNGEVRRNQVSSKKNAGSQISMNTAQVMVLEILRIITNSDFSDSCKVSLMHKYILALTEYRIAQAIEFQAHKNKKIFNVDHYVSEYRSRNRGTLTLLSEIVMSQCDLTEEAYDAILEHHHVLGFVAQAWNDVHNIENSEYYKTKDKGIAGGDILDGKRTIVIGQAVENLPKSKGERLKEIINLEERNMTHVNEALELVFESKALECVKQVINNNVERSWKQVDKFVPESPAKAEMYRAAFEFNKFMM